MLKYVEFVDKNRKLLVFILMVANLLAFLGILRLRINTDYELLIPKNSPHMRSYREMMKRFGSGDQLMVVLEYAENPVTPSHFAKILQMVEKLREIPGTKMVVSPIPEAIFVGFRAFNTRELMNRDFKRVLKFMDKMGYSDRIVAKGGKYYLMINVTPEASLSNIRLFIKEVRKTVEEIHPEFFMSGNSYLQTRIFDYLLKILFTLPPAAFLIMFLIFRFRIGSGKATIFSMIPAGLGSLWVMGTMGWMKGDISMITALVPIFTIIMGSADGLHFMSHYLENVDKMERKEAVAETLRAVGNALIMTTLTTMAGFLGLLMIPTTGMKQMGVFAAMGIGYAGLASWVILPLTTLSACINLPEKRGEGDPLHGFIVKMIGWRAVLISVLLIALFLPGIWLVKTDFNFITMYKPRTAVRRNVEKIREIFDISVPAFILYRSDENLISPKVGLHVLSLEDALQSSGLTGEVFSVYDILSRINSFFFGGAPGYPSNNVRAQFLYRLMNTQKFLDLSSFVNPAFKEGCIIFFPVDLSSSVLAGIEKRVEAFSTPEIEYDVTGLPYVIKDMNDRIVFDQNRVILVVLAIVAGMMFIVYRNILMVFISMLPVLITLVMLFGFMGYAGIDLSLVTSNMASITIGVGIDYSIHFAGMYRYYRRKNSDVEKALRETSKHVAKPVFANALGLALGISVMNFSPMTFHTWLSMIMWVTMLTSSFTSLTLVPTFIGRFDDRFLGARGKWL